MTAILKWLRSIPGWAWGVLAAIGALVGVFARGIARGRKTAQLERRADDAKLSEARRAKLNQQQKEREDRSNAIARKAASDRVEAKLEAEEMRTRMPTKAERDAILREAREWPDD